MNVPTMREAEGFAQTGDEGENKKKKSLLEFNDTVLCNKARSGWIEKQWKR